MGSVTYAIQKALMQANLDSSGPTSDIVES
jgi:hypothetical protein